MTLISIVKAAELLGIGRTTAYRLAKEGRLPCVRAFGPIRVHEEKLKEMINAEADRSVANQEQRDQQSECVLVSSPHPSHARTQTPAQLEKELDALLKLKPRRPK